ncbi:MAG TPA: diiron oxygenase [Actinospica sp.]|jgi:hypothetical protein|nr:diiron oxygenase [Actinospica sp.]
MDEPDERFRVLVRRLADMSERDYYNPYRLFEWPRELDGDAYWMSPDLMVETETAAGAGLSEQQLRALSKWSSVNFYSLNVHGIRELLVEMVNRIHRPGFEVPSEYFHHVIGEENEHMWFFATFCRKYGGKIYPDRSVPFPGPADPAIADFLVFARLLIFEELVDYFNSRMALDERLPETIRRLNAVHHQDESRHIAFGRRIVALLHEGLRAGSSAEQLHEVGEYLRRYMRTSVAGLCLPDVYLDAGIDEPYAFRRSVLADPGFEAFAERVLHRTTTFLVSSGIVSDERIATS